MLPVHFLFLYRKLLVSYKAKNAPRGCASRGEEVSCKQHRSSAKESQVTLCSKKMVAKIKPHTRHRRLLLQLRSKSWYNFEYMDFSIGKIDGMKQSIGGSCEDISGDRRGVD